MLVSPAKSERLDALTRPPGQLTGDDDARLPAVGAFGVTVESMIDVLREALASPYRSQRVGVLLSVYEQDWPGWRADDIECRRERGKQAAQSLHRTVFSLLHDTTVAGEKEITPMLSTKITVLLGDELRRLSSIWEVRPARRTGPPLQVE